MWLPFLNWFVEITASEGSGDRYYRRLARLQPYHRLIGSLHLRRRDEDAQLSRLAGAPLRTRGEGA